MLNSSTIQCILMMLSERWRNVYLNYNKYCSMYSYTHLMLWIKSFKNLPWFARTPLSTKSWKIWTFSEISFSKIDKSTSSGGHFMHNFDVFHFIFQKNFNKYIVNIRRVHATNKNKVSKGFPNRGDMILNVPIGLIWTEIFDVCCQLSSVRFAI